MNPKDELQVLFNKEKKLFIGLVHGSAYGPMKGMNAILKKLDQDKIHEVLSSQEKQKDLIIKFHAKTGLSCSLMVLPIEMSRKCSKAPEEFNDIDQLVSHLEKLSDSAVPLVKDPWYYRLGNL